MAFSLLGNGIRCFGKTNAQRRIGLCAGCRRESWLVSYDTRLWFSVCYVPLIPLGKRHVFDECIHCQRRALVEPGKWDQSAYLDTSNAKAHFESSPSADTAIRYHQCLLDYHQHEEAAKLCADMQREFANDAAMHAYLGSVLTKAGDVPAAVQAFDKAFSLDSTLPVAREGVAHRKIREGNLKGALNLLDFTQTPGAGKLHDLGVLEELAQRYQELGLHEEALAQWKLLVREQPVRAQVRRFREAVQVSEKAARSSPTCLPPIEHPLRWACATYRTPLLAGAVVLLLAGGLGLRGVMSRQQQVVHIINGFLTPISVRVDDGETTKVPNGHTTMTLVDGRHVAHVSGLVNEDIPFELKHSFWKRKPLNEALVMNLGGHAILRRRQVVFNADGSSQMKDLPEFMTGRRFFVAHEIDHAFEGLPALVPVPKGQRSLTLAELEHLDGTAVDVVGYFMSQQKPDRAMSFCESALDADGECDDAAELYAQIAAAQQFQARAIVFLQPRLQARPVRIALHRAWQDVRRMSGNAAVLEEYRALAAKEPNNGALVYLQGRLEDAVIGDKLFKHSTELDSKLAWGWFAQGISRSMRGEWSRALSLYEKAVAMRPANRRFVQKRDEALIGTNGWEQIKRDALATIKVKPDQPAATVALIEAQAALGQPDEALNVANAYVRNNSNSGAKRADLDAVLNFANYACGKFKEMLDQAGDKDLPAYQRARFQALIELGRVEDAAKEKFLVNGNPGFSDALALAVACKGAGQNDAAKHWEELAISSLRRSGEAAAALIGALESRTPPAVEAMGFNGLEAQDHALVFAWLAVKFPESKTVYGPMATRFNIRRMFSHFLVERTVAK